MQPGWCALRSHGAPCSQLLFPVIVRLSVEQVSPVDPSGKSPILLAHGDAKRTDGLLSSLSGHNLFGLHTWDAWASWSDSETRPLRLPLMQASSPQALTFPSASRLVPTASCKCREGLSQGKCFERRWLWMSAIELKCSSQVGSGQQKEPGSATEAML